MTTLFIFGAKYLYFVSIIIAIFYFLRQPRDRQKQMAIFACISIPIALILVWIAGHLYNDPRPFVVGNFTPLIPHAPDNGFPSDHTALVALIAAFFYFYNKRLSIALWIIAILVGISRIYVGVHHTIDIIGSIVIAILATMIASYILSYFRHYKKP